MRSKAQRAELISLAVLLAVTAWIGASWFSAYRAVRDVVISQDIWMELGAQGANDVVVRPTGAQFFRSRLTGDENFGWGFEVRQSNGKGGRIRLVANSLSLGGLRWRSVSREE